MRLEKVELSHTPISGNPDHILLTNLGRIASALEHKAESEERSFRLREVEHDREERRVRALESIARSKELEARASVSSAETQRDMAESLRRIADAVVTDPVKTVDTEYVRKKLGLKTRQGVRDRIKSDKGLKTCVLERSGNGRLIKFDRDKFHRWLEQQ